MAEADDQDKPPAQEWVLLGNLIKRKALKLGSLESAETWVRRQLHEGRLPFQYRDARGGLHSGKDLPGGFWLEASINPGEHSARCREKVVPTNPVLAEYVVRFTKPIWPQVAARAGETAGARIHDPGDRDLLRRGTGPAPGKTGKAFEGGARRRAGIAPARAQNQRGPRIQHPS